MLACHLTEEPVFPKGWPFCFLEEQFRFRLKGAEAVRPVQERFPIRTVLSAPHLKNKCYGKERGLGTCLFITSLFL